MTKKSKTDQTVTANPITDLMPGRDKVCIVGFTEHRLSAPFDDPSYEIWGMNALYRHGKPGEPFPPRADRWFDLHQWDIIDNERRTWYSRQGIPIYLQQAREEIPSSVEFPAQRIRDVFGTRYFTSSPAWMIAFALSLDPLPKEIAMYGIDMATDSEYAGQRPCIEHWIGRAEAMGVKFTLPQESDILSATHEYGYGTDGGFRKRLVERLKMFRQQLAEIDSHVAQLTAKRHTIDGARQATEWALQRTVADHSSMTSDSKALPAMQAPTQVQPASNGGRPKIVRDDDHGADVTDDGVSAAALVPAG